AAPLVTADTLTSRPAGTLIFSMCQGAAALQTLLEWELAGADVVNSPRASLNTYRDRLPAILQAAGISYPRTILVSTTAETEAQCPLPLDPASGVWLKRGDMHASVSADVQQVRSASGYRAGLAGFH